MLDRIKLLLAKSNGKLLVVEYSTLLTTGELCLLRRPGKQQILGTANLLEIKMSLMDQDIAARRSCSYSPILIIFGHTKHSHSLSSVMSFVQHPTLTMLLNFQACDFDTPWPLAATLPWSIDHAPLMDWKWAVEPLRIYWLTSEIMMNVAVEFILFLESKVSLNNLHSTQT